MPRTVALLSLLLAGCSDKVVRVVNDPPTVEIVDPDDGEALREGADLLVEAHMGDEETPDDLTPYWSIDPGGDLEGEQTIVDSTVTLAVAGGLAAGDYTLTLRVVDGGGEDDDDSVSFSVVPNAAPTLAFTAPTEGQRFADGADVVVRLALADDVDGALTLDWGELAEGAAGAPESGAAGETVSFTLPSPGIGEDWTVSVLATDAEGADAEASVRFSVEDGDKDDDGYIDEALGGDDCDDTNPEIHPGASERCNDLDDDCDGEIDEDAIDASTWYPDADADGYGSDADEIVACDQPEGALETRGDCDDADEAVNPGVDEICENGVDDDCDGTSNECGIDGLITLGVDDGVAFYGVDSSDEAGAAVGSPGDIDGDGLGDLAIGASGAEREKGAIYLFWGRASWESAYSVADADLILVGDSTYDHAGARLAAADLDMDGQGELLVAAPDSDASGTGSGSIYLLFGDELPATGSALGALASYLGEDNGDHAGESVALGDVDGDGYGDALVGSPGIDTDASAVGRAYLLLWDTLASADGLALGGADALYTGTEGSGTVGDAVAIGDLDGDGYGEIVVGATGVSNADGARAGAAFVIAGATTPDTRNLPDEADVAIHGEGGSDLLGAALVVLPWEDAGALGVGAPGADDPYGGAGAVWIFAGLPDGTLGSAWTTLVGNDTGDGLGDQLAAAGDTEGDGLVDLLVGAPDESASNQGSAFLFLGSAWAAGGALSASESDAWLQGPGGGDRAGSGVGPAGDADGDGYGDVLVGASGENTMGGDAGAVWLLLGGGV